MNLLKRKGSFKSRNFSYMLINKLNSSAFQPEHHHQSKPPPKPDVFYR